MFISQADLPSWRSTWTAIAILAKIDTIAWAKGDAPFGHTLAERYARKARSFRYGKMLSGAVYNCL